MTRMPGAVWDPLAGNWFRQPLMRAHNIVCVHTMVGSLSGTRRWFADGNGPGYHGSESHFGTFPDGRKLQWQDIAHSADANRDGNGDVISIENADMGPGFPDWDTGSADNVPPFTPAQVEANAQIIAWACSTEAHADCPRSWVCHREGIPIRLVPDTRPGRRGIAYHRQGCDPWRVEGGVRWSSSYGKGCPGPARIRQTVNLIIPRARQIAGGLEDNLPTPEEIVDELLRRKLAVNHTDRFGVDHRGTTVADALEHILFTLTPGQAGFRHTGTTFRLLADAAQNSAVARRVAEQQARDGGQLSEDALARIRAEVEAELAEQLAEVEAGR